MPFCFCGHPAICLSSSQGRWYLKCARRGCGFHAMTVASENKTLHPTASLVGCCGENNEEQLTVCFFCDFPLTLRDRIVASTQSLRISTTGNGASCGPSSASTCATLTFPWEKYGEVHRIINDICCTDQQQSIAAQPHAPQQGGAMMAAQQRSIATTTNTNVQMRGIPSFVFEVLQHAKKTNEGNKGCGMTSEELLLFEGIKDYQRHGVNFLIRLGGRGILADEMGLGKTLQAIATMHHFRDEWPLLVICPTSLVFNWQREIEHWTKLPANNIQVIRKKLPASAFDQHDVQRNRAYIIGYNTLSYLSEFKDRFPCIVVDESHYIKNRQAKRTQLVRELCSHASRVVLISGTPALSRPEELYPQLEVVLGRRCAIHFNHFAERYCNAFKRIIKETIPPVNDTKGSCNLTELNLLVRNIMLRRVKAEVLSELPAKNRTTVYIEVAAKDKLALTPQDIRQVEQRLGDDAAGVSATPSIMEKFARTAAAKLSAVKSYVKELLAEDDETLKYLVFSHHTVMLDGIEHMIREMKAGKKPIDYIRIDGSTNVAARDSLVTHFNAAPTCRIAILSITAAGVGLNFTSANHVIFTELFWNPSSLRQCEDRVHRMGQQRECHIRYLLACGTVDDLIWPILNNKLSITNQVLSDDVLRGDKTMCENDTRPNNSGHSKNQHPRPNGATNQSGSASAASAGQRTLDMWIQAAPPHEKTQNASGREVSPSALRCAQTFDNLVTNMSFVQPRSLNSSSSATCGEMKALTTMNTNSNSYPTEGGASTGTTIPQSLSTTVVASATASATVTARSSPSVLTPQHVNPAFRKTLFRSQPSASTATTTTCSPSNESSVVLTSATTTTIATPVNNLVPQSSSSAHTSPRNSNTKRDRGEQETGGDCDDVVVVGASSNTNSPKSFVDVDEAL